MEWNKIHTNDLSNWQRELFNSGSSLFQFPAWLSSFRHLKFFSPIFLAGSTAYCGLLQINIGLFKIALIPYGPVFMSDNENEQIAAFSSLIERLKKEKYTFIRITGQGTTIARLVKGNDIIDNYNSFPFYKEVTKNWFVERKIDSAALKTSFQGNVKNKINKAEKAGIYRFLIDNDGKYLDEVYNLFIKTGKRKGFNYRPVASYRSLFENTSGQFATQYLCFNGNNIVNALLILRDKQTSLVMSSALDTELMQDNISPAAFLHYFAMQHEFYNIGTQYYNLVYSSGAVGEFKQSFNPILIQEQESLTIVLDKNGYNLYKLLALKFAPSLKKIGRQIILLFQK